MTTGNAAASRPTATERAARDASANTSTCPSDRKNGVEQHLAQHRPAEQHLRRRGSQVEEQFTRVEEVPHRHGAEDDLLRGGQVQVVVVGDGGGGEPEKEQRREEARESQHPAHSRRSSHALPRLVSGHNDAVSSPRRTAVWLFLFLNALFILTSSGRVRVIDEVLPVYQIESLAERGSTAVPQAVSADFFFGKRDLAGRPQAPYPPGAAALAVPWYLAGKHVLLRLPGVGPRARTMVSDFAIVTSSASFVAAAAALAFVLFVSLGLTQRQALLAALGLTFGTPSFAYSAWYFSEPLTVAVADGGGGRALSPWPRCGSPFATRWSPGWRSAFSSGYGPPTSSSFRWCWRRCLPARASGAESFQPSRSSPASWAWRGLGLLARNNMLYGSPFDLGLSAERRRRTGDDGVRHAARRRPLRVPAVTRQVACCCSRPSCCWRRGRCRACGGTRGRWRRPHDRRRSWCCCCSIRATRCSRADTASVRAI